MPRERGFSLIELVMAMALMMVAVGSVFSLLHPAQGAFSTEPEVADLQQRLRVAENALFTDLVMAGAGAYLGRRTGSLLYFFPPVRPLRQGAITVIYVPTTAAQTTLAHDVLGGGVMSVNVESGCPKNPDGTPQNLCGFRPQTTVLIFDDSGNYDTFTVSSVDDAAATMTAKELDDALTTTYRGGPPGTRGIATLTEAVIRTYFRKAETNQLVYADGLMGSAVPVVDNVVDLSFEYWGDPNPPRRTPIPISDAIGPWQTYGPRPTIGPSGSAYPANENCAFTYDGSRHVPRLPVLLSGENATALVALTESQLTDGLPGWCPDENHGNRYDVDLLRIRKIGVTIRVQAALAALRGPAGVLFRNGGTSRTATKWVPDQEVAVQVSPRNLNLGR